MEKHTVKVISNNFHQLHSSHRSNSMPKKNGLTQMKTWKAASKVRRHPLVLGLSWPLQACLLIIVLSVMMFTAVSLTEILQITSIMTTKDGWRTSSRYYT